MSLSVAEVYMLALRKSLVPIVGEAVPFPFELQIELDSWNWNLLPPEKDDKTDKDKNKDKDKDKDKAKDKAGKSTGADAARAKKADEGIVKVIEGIQKDSRRTQAQRDRAVLDKLRESQEQRRKDDAEGDDRGESNKPKAGRLSFTFSKNVDLATTQLLNCMKAGEVLPRVIITVFHRSVNAPVTLVIKMEKVTLVKYSLDVDVTDTMSDLRESWDAKFEALEYAYQNRPSVSGIPGVTEATARVFKMKSASII